MADETTGHRRDEAPRDGSLGDATESTEPSEALEEEAEESFERELRLERVEDEAVAAAGATRLWPLAVEHELLGAVMGLHHDGTPFVERYGLAPGEPDDGEAGSRDPGEWEATVRACGLCDLSDLSSLLIGGEGAASFTATVFAGSLPAVGESVYSLALSGDGSVVAPVLLSAVAEEDFLVLVPGGLAEGLRAWLEALCGLAGEAGPLWPHVALEDPVRPLVCLALLGPATAEVLGDYLARGESLPARGTVRRLLLDRIVTTCVGLPAPADAWLVFLPPTVAPTIWRSLLSFEQVTPVGTPVVWGRLVEGLPGLAAYLEAPIRPFTPAELGLEGLLRPEGGFIGARSLGIGPRPAPDADPASD